jgi:hypothetical protein
VAGRSAERRHVRRSRASCARGIRTSLYIKVSSSISASPSRARQISSHRASCRPLAKRQHSRLIPARPSVAGRSAACMHENSASPISMARTDEHFRLYLTVFWDARRVREETNHIH